MAFGLFSLGEDPFAGISELEIDLVRPERRNAILVRFNTRPLADDIEGFDSATNVASWSLVAIDPTITTAQGDIVPFGEAVPTVTPEIIGAELADDVDALEASIRLFTDARMEKRVLYELTANSRIEGRDGELFVGTMVHEFRGLGFSKALKRDRAPDQPYRDLDTLSRADTFLQTGGFAFDSTNDIKIHAGAASLKKRIYRRLLTRPGDFAHLPNYGSRPRIKANVQSGTLQSLANDLALQVQREPDVIDASVSVRFDAATGLLDISVFVRQNDNTTRQLEFPIEL